MFHVAGLLLCVLADQYLCFSTLSLSRFLRETDLSVTGGIHSGYQGVLPRLEIEHEGHKESENETFEVPNVYVTLQQDWKPQLLQKPAMPADEESNDTC